MSNTNIYTLTNQTTGQLIAASAGSIKTVILTPTTTKSVIKLYDGLSAAGTLLVELRAAADVTSQLHGLSISYNTGIWAVVDNATSYLGVEAEVSTGFTVAGAAAGQ